MYSFVLSLGQEWGRIAILSSKILELRKNYSLCRAVQANVLVLYNLCVLLARDSYQEAEYLSSGANILSGYHKCRDSRIRAVQMVCT